MDIAWNDLRLFLAVAETGSLSGAARKLRVGQPTVTRRLASLDADRHQSGPDSYVQNGIRYVRLR